MHGVCPSSSKDPEDAVMAHSLYDPHLEPQDDDAELEDPSMLPSSGIGFEIEKRDQYREGLSTKNYITHASPADLPSIFR